MVVATSPIELSSALTEQQARDIFARGEEAVVFALLQLAQRLAVMNGAATAMSHDTSATPSGMKPTYLKPNISRRRKKPGRKAGHPGSRREPPARIDQRETHRAEVCPDCGGPLNRCSETRARYTEDIPEVQPVVTGPSFGRCPTIHRDWCPQCC